MTARTERIETTSEAVEVGPLRLTEQHLLQFNGVDATKPIYLAIKGQIFDVSAKREFYGPGGAYSIFSGKDASRALGKSSTNEEDVSSDYSSLSEAEVWWF